MKFRFVYEKTPDIIALSRKYTLTNRQMFDLGVIARQVQNDRLDEGLDVSRKKMRGYSASYKARRQALGKQTSIVDLTNTGRMRNSISVRAGQLTAELNVNDHREAAHGTDKARNWWGICKEASRQIDAKVREFLK